MNAIARRHALTIGLAAPFALAACSSQRNPFPTDSTAFFADIDAAIASAQALVSWASVFTDAATVEMAQKIIDKAKSLEASAKAALLSGGGWKDLADAALRILSGIVWTAAAPAPASAPGAAAPGAAPAVTMSLRHSG